MSPRPKKPRNFSCPFRAESETVFKPAGSPMKDLEKVYLEGDELEAVRLCDGEGLTQQQAGAKMGISRGTVQRLVVRGRKKLIDAIVNSQALVINTSEAEDASD